MTTTRTSSTALRRIARAVLLAAPALAPAACSTGYVVIAPDTVAATKRLSPAEGSASSHLATVYPPWFPILCFVPWGWDARAQSAYGEAVAGVPGATALGDVSIQEDWTWWFLGTSRTLTIRGQAVRP